MLRLQISDFRFRAWVSDLGFQISDFRFGISELEFQLGFQISDLGFQSWDSAFRICDFTFGTSDLGLRMWDCGFGVSDSRFWILGGGFQSCDVSLRISYLRFLQRNLTSGCILLQNVNCASKCASAVHTAILKSGTFSKSASFLEKCCFFQKVPVFGTAKSQHRKVLENPAHFEKCWFFKNSSAF